MVRTLVRILFALLVLGGLWIRTTRLDEIPVHLSNDEISIAYDAYSIARTGAEEHGTKWPISFQSHGTYKAPVYAYLLAPLTLILPNNNLTPRLVSVIAGLLTCVVVGLLASQIFENKKTGYWTALALLWTPWHISTSRMVYESNLALLFTSIFLLSQIKIRQNSKPFWLIVEILSGTLAMYSYHTQWVLIPILLIVELIFTKLSNKKRFVVLLGFAILILPLVQDYRHNLGTGARANSEVIWKEGKTAQALKNTNFFGKVKMVPGIYGLFSMQKNRLFEMPLFWSIWVILFIIGIRKLFLNRKLIKSANWLFIMWLVCPIVPALTHGGVNSLRNLPSVIPIILICVYGFFTLNSKSKLLVFILTIAQFVLFSGVYFVHAPINRASSYQSYRDLIPFIKENYSRYDQIVVDSKFGDDALLYGVPHLYLAYYSTLNPIALQKRSNDPLGGMRFNKFTVTELDWSKRVLEKNTLYVSANANKPSADVEKSLELLKTIKDGSDRPSFLIWKIR